MKEQRLIVWLTLGIILLVLLNLPQSISRQAKAALREGIAPLHSLLSGFTRKAREGVNSIRGLGGLMRENQTMITEVARLRSEVRSLKFLESENIALRHQLNFTAQSPRRLLACEVIARDISGWWQTIRLGKGSADGIAPNMAVMTSVGLVGKTLDVSPRTSDVLLLSDPSCKISAQIIRTGLFGIVSGQGTSVRGQVVCLMDFVNKATPVKPGDEVVSSGLGGVFPKGLLLGYVEKVFTDRTGLYQKAYVIPKADIGGLDYVFVVKEDSNPIEELLRKKGLSISGSL